MPPIVAFTVEMFCYAFWVIVGWGIIRALFFIGDMIIKFIAAEVVGDFYPEMKARINSGESPPIWLYVVILISLTGIATAFFWQGWRAAAIVAGAVGLGATALLLTATGISTLIAAAVITYRGAMNGDFKSYRNIAISVAYLVLVGIWFTWRGVAGGVCAALVFGVLLAFLLWAARSIKQTFAGAVSGDFDSVFNAAILATWILLSSIGFAVKMFEGGFTAAYLGGIVLAVVWLSVRGIRKLMVRQSLADTTTGNRQ